MTKQELISMVHGWRNQQTNHAKSGVVLIFDGEVYGWKNCLRDPSHERPNAIAVDAEDNVFMAMGGDDESGATAWVAIDDDEIEQVTKPKRENGWYWVFRKSEYSPEPYWSVMLWEGDSDSWLVSGIEWPTYEDSDMIEIKPERLKAPDEQ